MNGHGSSCRASSLLSAANNDDVAAGGVRDQARRAHSSVLSADNIAARQCIVQAAPLAWPDEMRGVIK